MRHTLTRQCIYCLQSKRLCLFNTEHVLPQSFGKFKNNLTIDCTCEECNSYFANGFELSLGRDSLEGFERFRRGLKRVTEYKHLGKTARNFVRVETPGVTYGAIAFPRPNRAGSFAVGLASQIGFGRREEDQPLWFEIDNLPTWSELRKLLGIPPGKIDTVFVRGLETAPESGREALKAKGFPLESFVETRPVNEGVSPGHVQVQHSFPIGSPQFRAMSKISLNYVAAIFGSQIALMPQLNEIRRFVRYAETVPPKTIAFSRSSQVVKFADSSSQGHYILVQTIGNRLLANVSLFCEFDYQIWLSSVPFLVEVNLNAGDFFDLRAQNVQALTLNPLRNSFYFGRQKRE